MSRRLKPDRPCKVAVGDEVDVLNALGGAQDRGVVRETKWSGDGSDVGWWITVECRNGKRYVCHSSNVRRVDRSVVDRLADVGE